jgi:hypothetical protein
MKAVAAVVVALGRVDAGEGAKIGGQPLDRRRKAMGLHSAGHCILRKDQKEAGRAEAKRHQKNLAAITTHRTASTVVGELSTKRVMAKTRLRAMAKMALMCRRAVAEAKAGLLACLRCLPIPEAETVA